MDDGTTWTLAATFNLCVDTIVTQFNIGVGAVLDARRLLGGEQVRGCDATTVEPV